ncbi:YceI family protein [Pseudoxanthomonas daejeonensis]|nr:YceI family protein [Pseudoxanthomonas daejeonensis]UNK56622.1 YceI family protein [Pseudoxanthomonas daejeonensis]
MSADSTSLPPIRRGPAARAARLLLAWLTLVPALAGAAQARYELDPVHTRVLFAISHAGFSQALGTLSGSTGTLEFDPDDWSQARLDVNVPLQRLDLGDDGWNRAALARNLLDAQRWPEARFVSTRVESLAPDRFIVHGELTLRGVTREVPLQVTFNALKRHPLPPFRRTAGFSATATLSRQAFGMDAWPSVIGDQVELRIEAEALRSTRAGDGKATTDDDGIAPAPGADADTPPPASDDPADSPAPPPDSPPEPQDPTPP